MKFKKFHILIFSFFSFSNFLFCQWNYFETLPASSQYFADAIFISPDSGMYTGGGSGKILATTDAGNSWNTVLSTSASAEEIYYQHGVIFFRWNTGQGGDAMYATKDFGQNWFGIPGLWGYSADFSSPSPNVNFTIGGYNPIMLSKCDDYQNCNIIYTFSGIYPRKITFLDSLTGFFVYADTADNKNHGILKTITGGTSWITSFSDSALSIKAINFFDGVGYAVGENGAAIKTLDTGATWQYLNTGILKNLNSVFFLNDSLGFAAGDTGTIIRTTNGGINWSVDIVPANKSFSKIYFVNDSIGFAHEGNVLYIINLNWPLKVWQEHNFTRELAISPNPNTGKCNITIPDEFSKEENLTLRIFDNTGKLIQEQTVEMYEDKVKVNLEAEAKGIYNVTLSNKKKSYAGKIVFE